MGSARPWSERPWSNAASPLSLPPRANRTIQIDHDKALCRQRHTIENMFARLKDGRRIHTRYDRCAHAFMSAGARAATVIFCINQ